MSQDRVMLMLAVVLFGFLFFAVKVHYERLEKTSFVMGCTVDGKMDRVICAERYREWVDAGRP